VQFIASLPDASKEQIEDNNDVCSICLHDMKSAKITPCNHFYHEICLRKWLTPYKDTGYNWHNKTHDENKQNKNAQHKTKNM
jgi:hypothetical protein